MSHRRHVAWLDAAAALSYTLGRGNSLTTHVLSRTRSIWLWAAAALILDLAGSQHVYTQPAVAAAVLAGLVVAWLVPVSFWQPADRAATPAAPLLALLPLAAFVAALIDVATFVPIDGGWSPERLWLLIGGGVLLLALGLGYVRGRLAAGVVALAALGLGTLVRLIHMDYIPIEPANGDMLPLVQGALDHLLAGRSPYRTYQMPWDVPLTYLPVTWLAYLPPYLLGLDLRWTNFAAELTIGGALAWLGARYAGAARGATTRRQSWLAEPTLLLWAWLFLQPSVIHWDMGNTAPITWALLAVTVALVLAEHDRAGAVALGLTAAGTPLVAVFGPFIGLYWLRQRGLVQTIRLVLISAVVAALFVVPFLLWAPGDFINGTYRWFNTLEGWPRQKWLETDPPIWSVITGFSGEFWSRGTERWLKPIQALIVLGVAGLYWLRGAPAERLSQHAAAAYLGFMLFNPVLWPYLYNPALVVGLVGLAAPIAAYTAARQPVPVAESRSQPTFS